MTTLYVVVPCYNEEEVLPETSRRLGEKLDALEAAGRISKDSRVLFVDDGSKDRTWQLISGLHQKDDRFGGVKLSRNRGHQNALLAGLMTAKDLCDAAISMDADLQDDINAMDRMLDAFETGCDIVYNHADYRLMSRRALEGLADYDEVNLFLRGIVPLIGYKSTTVEYERAERFAGESKYPLKKMLAFAFDGITSFSVKPIRWVTGLGVLIFAASILALIYILIVKLLGYTVTGWSTTTASIWLLGGLQLLSLGIVGEYVGKIYMEVKARPRYLIEALELTPPEEKE